MSGHVKDCLNNGTEFTFLSEFQERPDGWPEIEAVIFIIIFLMSILSNIIMLMLVGPKCSVSSAHFHLVNLCVSELLFTLGIPVVVITRITVDWKLGTFLCKAVNYLSFACGMNLLLTLTIISIDRYLCLSKGGQHRLSKRAVLSVIILTWIISLIFPIPVALMQSVESVHVADKQYYDCMSSSTIMSTTENVLSWNKDCEKFCEKRSFCGISWSQHFNSLVYLISINILFFFLPILLMCVFYVKIFLIVNKSSKNIRRHATGLSPSTTAAHTSHPHAVHSHSEPSHHINNHEKQQTCCGFCLKLFPHNSPRHQIQLVRMSLSLVFSFLLLWPPFLTLTWVAPLADSVSSTGFTITLMLAYSSTCVNPVLYGYFNPACRQRFKGFFKKDGALSTERNYGQDTIYSTNAVSTTSFTPTQRDTSNLQIRRY